MNNCLGAYNSKYYSLISDIDLSLYEWVPIGFYNFNFDEKYYFCGEFNGNGHVISGLTIDQEDTKFESFGLFGQINKATISGLILKGASINVCSSLGMEGYFAEGYCNTGAIAGIAYNESVIRDCEVEAEITVKAHTDCYVGGAVGKFENGGLLENCEIKGSIKLNATVGSSIGGTAGHTRGETTIIKETCFEGNLRVEEETPTGYPGRCGGIIGSVWQSNLVIVNCRAICTIFGPDAGFGGGLVGFVENGNEDASFICQYTFCQTKLVYNDQEIYIEPFGGGYPRMSVSSGAAVTVLDSIGYFDDDSFYSLINEGTLVGQNILYFTELDLSENDPADIFYNILGFLPDIWYLPGDAEYPLIRYERIAESIDAAGEFIVSQPSDYEGPVGDTAIFSIDTRRDDLFYRWEFRVSEHNRWMPVPASIKGYNTNRIEVPIIYQYMRGYQYRCHVIDREGRYDISAAAEIAVNGGYVTWELLSDGTLVIGGEGEIPCFNFTYYENLTGINIVNIIIEEGVTGIGELAFYGLSHLENVTIKGTMDSIKGAAFFECSSLEHFVVPEGVVSIGDDAFAYCTSLKSLTIPRSVREIGWRVCYQDTNFSDIYYQGTLEEWNEISIGRGGNDDFFNAELHTIIYEYAFIGWTWAEDLENAIAVFRDINDETVQKAITVPAEKEIIPADCVEAGAEIYSVTIRADESPDGKEHSDSRTLEVKALGHEWGTPTYTWASDYSTVTAEVVCSHNEAHMRTETVATTAEITKEATYDEEGEMVYTAVFESDIFTTQKKTAAIPKKERPANPFEDVTEGKYYYDAVMWALNHEPAITTGLDDTHFGPNETCTRSQVVTFLWRAAGCPEPKETTNPFTDVKKSAFFYKAVLWAVENKITTGTSDTTFGPGDGCTRGQVVTFMYRTKGSPEITGSSNPFKDVKSSAYYYKPVMWAVEQKITTGTAAAAFSPNDTCTRGQIVTFLYRAFAESQ